MVAIVHAQTSPRPTSEWAPHPARILVLGDAATATVNWFRSIQRQGHGVQLFVSSKAGCAAFGSKPYDVILLHRSAGTSALLSFLKDREQTQDAAATPVVVIDDPGMMGRVTQYSRLGATDYLPDPPNETLLEAKIDDARRRADATRTRQALLDRLSEERQRSDKLLLNVLPRSIAERLRNGEKTIVDFHADSTVLFCDVVGYTVYASQASAADLINRLNELFQVFDRLAKRYGLEKIKTIGDAYMLAGGIPEPMSDHAAAVADIAVAMLRSTSQLATKYAEPWQLRIGVHSGPAVAGIIGQNKFSYDLWGETVNIASRMESTGISGKIQITDATRERLAGAFLTEPREPITIKGVGEMTTYFLKGRL